jgi:pyrrolidone-carboxylate peptidase
MRLKAACLCLSLIVSTHSLAASVEEKRLDAAKTAMPHLLAPFETQISKLSSSLATAKNSQEVDTLLISAGQVLWNNARQQARQTTDDRPLYWARLTMTQQIRDGKMGFDANAAQRNSWLALFEQSSRGIQDIRYTQGVKRILLTGFDPFLLDRNINQSNPSGLAALLLDGKFIEVNGQQAQIETVIAPVRFADFDAGFVEDLLTPYFKLPVDLIVTVSMGRKDFDLERYPGLRRSADFPDNLNIKTGGTLKTPVLPLLKGSALAGAEFVEFGLPAKAMLAVQQPFSVHDNCTISSLRQKDFCPKNLAELAKEVSVEGSGGGYLSNEISYRSLRLRDQLGAKIPVGHIHTPAIKQYDADKEAAIVQQIEELLKAALAK